jgi:hypothetical protein
MESRQSPKLTAPWDHDPIERSAAVPAAPGRRDACPTLRLMEDEPAPILPSEPLSTPAQRICPRTGRIIGQHDPRRRLIWTVSVPGALALIWFLVRVLPKPSRATYPCQRVAFPVASGFVAWILALLGSAFAWRKARRREARFWKACAWGAVAALGITCVVANLPAPRAAAESPNAPVGEAKGIFPGRVVWVHAPDAVNWNGYTSSEPWWQTNHTDLAVVEEMLSKAIRSVGGGSTDAEAWDALFRYFNQTHARGSRGYQAGEKIAIKINLTTCNARSGTSTVDIHGTYEKRNAYSDGHWMNTIDNSPQMILTLLRHLVYTVGVQPTDISVGDPTGLFPKYMWDRLHPEFPAVHYFDNFGGAGRTRTEFSGVEFNWSAPDAAGKVQDYVPQPFAQADYLINFAILKGHSVGVTLCAKNLYGALLRCPDGYFRDALGRDQPGTLDYLNLHASTPDPGISTAQGLGHYRALVDLMGHPALGGNTLLCLVDGLFGGYFWDSHPQKWNSAPFNGDWPSSLFASQDPVAIDSVCYDFLLNEWPNVVSNGSASPGNGLQGGAEDYLHEAAQASNPASGTLYDPGKTGSRLASLGVHEHWNNAAEKQYSRNLGTGVGIELVALTATRPEAQLAIQSESRQAVLSWQGSLPGYRLQSAPRLDQPIPWSDVGAMPALVRGRNTITNLVPDPNRFYRLIQ